MYKCKCVQETHIKCVVGKSFSTPDVDLVAKGQGVVTNNKMRLKSHVTHLPDRREREGEREVSEGEEWGEKRKRENISSTQYQYIVP